MTAISKDVMYYVATAVFAVTCAAAFFVIKRLKKPRPIPQPVPSAFKLNINVVSNSEECKPLIYELRRRSMGHNAIGFDCEWVTKEGGRQPVALLQLSTYDGFCVLFRLNLIDPLPSSLKSILQDISIYKVGVAPLNDANYLNLDHGLPTRSTMDLRYFAEMCGYSARGLAHLSESLLGVELDKRLKVRCCNWDADILTADQIHYAASDAHAAIRIFVKLGNELNKPSNRHTWCSTDCDDSIWDVLDGVCSKYTDFSYKYKQSKPPKTEESTSSRSIKKKKKIRDPLVWKGYAASLMRCKPFYDNCLLQAPDGELLSTCDSKKAAWYVEKGLADLIDQEPVTVRLRFEPAGRSVGEVGQYYQQKKKNQCVVCAEQNLFIRKNVVPREYRRYFPDIMKDHSSHDIVLMCQHCHQRSNMRDQEMRLELATTCHAPLPKNKFPRSIVDRRCIKVRMAARALSNFLIGKITIPEIRKKELEAVVLNYYTEHQEVTEELLQEAAELSDIIESEPHNIMMIESHGETVVKWFLNNGETGLLRLEELWRTHFLNSMQPKHMPELWSISHNLDRLRVKWEEGRLSQEEMQLMGVKIWQQTAPVL